MSFVSSLVILPTRVNSLNVALLSQAGWRSCTVLCERWSSEQLNADCTSRSLWRRLRVAEGCFMNKRSLRWPRDSQHVHQMSNVLERDTELLAVCFTAWNKQSEPRVVSGSAATPKHCPTFNMNGSVWIRWKLTQDTSSREWFHFWCLSGRFQIVKQKQRIEVKCNNTSFIFHMSCVDH